MEEKLLTPLYHPGLTMAEIWQGVGRVLDAVRSLLTLPLKLRPTGLGSGIDKDRPDYTVYTGECEHSVPRFSPKTVAFAIASDAVQDCSPRPQSKTVRCLHPCLRPLPACVFAPCHVTT
jgi:hypothetical protein